MKTNEIREKYLDFFKSKGHTVCQSDVLVPTWDNTVLFTPAGMNPFKDHFLGNVELEFTRATSCQKCLRTGDIENVGRTAYHHTFFEMLGNFSFGDYFKRDAIHWAWEFLTGQQWMQIDPARLSVTVYLDDDEAANIWHEQVGVPADRITRLGEHDNFWPAGAPTDGPDGVCGPCSEIFFHPDEGPECEIWNLVFTQFRREGGPPDNLHPLPSKNIDTGMGLERMAATLQGVETNYHIDSLKPIVLAAAEICHKTYVPDSDDGRRLRRICDHVRACTMAIHENTYPGPQKAEYVIRRLLRRAVLQGHDMGIREPFLYQVVDSVVASFQDVYPELGETAERVKGVIQHEESGFFRTLEGGLEKMESVFSEMKASNQSQVDGEVAASLYQTFGIPSELFESIAREQGFDFDWDGFHQSMEKHAKGSGDGMTGVMGNSSPLNDIQQSAKSTRFLGYDATTSQSTLLGIVTRRTENNEIEETRHEKLTASNEEEQIIVLDQTPFYAESGGQVGDSGTLQGTEGIFEVHDVKKLGDLFLHFGKLTKGSLSQSEQVTATVDIVRRKGIERAHSATHILHYALQQNLGEHAQQRGSKVEQDEFRFDFSNLEPVNDDMIDQIENQTAERIAESAEIKWETLPLNDAKEQGAMMLFGEKYPDPVRMVTIGDYSRELCGGTHLTNTSQIEAFEIVQETGVSSGTRRIVAITGKRAQQAKLDVTKSADACSQLLDVSIDHLPQAVQILVDEIKALKKQMAGGKTADVPKLSDAKKNGALDYGTTRKIMKSVAALLNTPLARIDEKVEGLLNEKSQLRDKLNAMANEPTIDAETLIEGALLVGDVKLIVQNLPHSNPGIMRTLIDQVRKKVGSSAIFLATAPADDKVTLVAGISRDLVDKGISAGAWVKEIAPVVGGGGGGKPDLAQAGGKQPENIAPALQQAVDYMKGQVAV